jgi:MYXO-CTERM domain-containing protein
MTRFILFRTSLAGWALLLAGAAPRATAGGICLIPDVAASNTSTATYASFNVTAGCNVGFSTSISGTGTISPSSLGAGLTSGALTVTDVYSPTGGVGISTTYANLVQGVLKDYSNAQGPEIPGFGYTRLRAVSTSGFEDTAHFTITDASPMVTVTLNAHLDGTNGNEGGDPLAHYSVVQEFGYDTTVLGCWQSTGPSSSAFGKCTGGTIPAVYTNQAATGFDATATFQVSTASAHLIWATLQTDCSEGMLCDYGHTATFSFTLPSDVTFTSDSGLFSQLPASSPTPEPGTAALVVVALGGLWRWRRHKAKSVASI